MQIRRSTAPTGASRGGPYPTLHSIPWICRLLFSFFLASFACAGVAASNVVGYTYDAAGNIVQIARQSAGGLAITSFTPGGGAFGTAVTIYGSGFDPTPAGNAVKFNGTVAAVTASTSGSISTTVPPGATTGPISVSVGASTAMSAQAFAISLLGEPTITGFTPATGGPTTVVAVDGTAFDTTAGATTVKLNGVTAIATVASDTSLSFTVPASAASGKITATTSSGTGVSADDFIVPPPGVSTTDIVATIRVTPGGASANVAVPGANKRALVLFDAQPGVYYSVQFGAVAISPTTATVSYQLIKPDNTVLQSGAINGASNRPTIHLPLLESAGTYAIVLSPGSATLNANVRVELNPVTSVDGPPVASSLDFTFQSARFAFTALANQHVGVGIAGIAFTPNSTGLGVNVQVLRPDGSQAASASCFGNQSQNPENNCDTEFTASVDGTYTLVMDTGSTSFANATVQFASEAAGSLVPDVVQPVALARAGQDARYTFTAAAGDSLAIDVSAATLQPRAQRLYVTIWKPDGSFLKTCSSLPPATNYCEMFTVATAGSYSITVDPSYGAYGSFNLILKQGPMLHATDPATPFASTGASEDERFRFSASAGQSLSIGLGDLAYDVGTSNALVVFAPNGAVVGTAGASCNTTFAAGHCRWSGTNLPQSGTYSVQVQPTSGAKMSGNITLSDPVAGVLAPSMPNAIDAGREGQVARFAFEGAAGDSTSVKLMGVSTSPSGRSVDLTVYRPDGSSLGSTRLNPPATAAMINLASLPTTGSYTVVVDPTTGGSWQGTLLLDPGAPLDVDGSAVSPATTNPGESLRYTFSLVAGQRVDFGMISLAYGQSGNSTTYVGIFSPSGSSLGTTSCVPSLIGCELSIGAAPLTGTYALIVTPPIAGTITGGSFALSTPLAGTFNVGDPAQTIAIDRQGQTARYTFNGTSGQTLRINWISVTVSGGNVAAVIVRIYKPDGSLLNSTSFVDGANGGVDVLTLPTSGTYTVLFDPTSAQTMSASVSLVNR